MIQVLSDYPVTVEQPVVWGDLDPNGHVNNIGYFQYVENARVALYQQIGKYDRGPEEGIILVLASTSCQFKQALSFGDIVVTGVRISSVSEDRFTTSYRLVRKADRIIVAEAEAVSVAFDIHKKTKTPIPQEVRERIAHLSAYKTVKS